MNYLIDTALITLVAGAILSGYVILMFYAYIFYDKRQFHKLKEQEVYIEEARRMSLLDPKKLFESFTKIHEESVANSKYEEAQLTNDILKELKKGKLPELMFNNYEVSPNEVVSIVLDSGMPKMEKTVTYNIKRLDTDQDNN